MPLAGLPGGPGAATPATGPSALTPGMQPGIDAQAMLKVRQAAMMLSEAVGMLKARINTDLGKAVLSALKTLAPHTPGVEEGLGQSELASMQQGVQAVRPAPPSFLGTKAPMPSMMGRPTMPPAPGPVPVGR